MINEVVLVGKFKEEKGFIEYHQIPYLCITLEVEKAFKNQDGYYEKDEVDCLLWKGEAERLLDNLDHVCWLSIKGRLEKLNQDKMYVFAEKVKFLDSLLRQ